MENSDRLQVLQSFGSFYFLGAISVASLLITLVPRIGKISWVPAIALNTLTVLLYLGMIAMLLLGFIYLRKAHEESDL